MLLEFAGGFRHDLYVFVPTRSIAIEQVWKHRDNTDRTRLARLLQLAFVEQLRSIKCTVIRLPSGSGLINHNVFAKQLGGGGMEQVPR